MNWLISVLIPALVILLTWHRRGVAITQHDGLAYAAMCNRRRVPQPYSRRWLLPMLLRGCGIRGWTVVSWGALLATGPLVYTLTSSLPCVWFACWLPGVAIAARYPVLVDAVAFAMVVLGACLYRAGYLWPAIAVMVVAGQVKESAPIFGAILCPEGAMVALALSSTSLALILGDTFGSPAAEDWQKRPWKAARGKHQWQDWSTMLLPWGGLAVVAALSWDPGDAWRVAMLSLAAAYAQMFLANDEARLMSWAAPAVLVAVAGYSGPALIPALVAHPFLCGACKRV